MTMVDLRDLEPDPHLQARHATELREDLLAERDRLIAFPLMRERLHPRAMHDDLLLQLKARLGEQLLGDFVDKRPALGLLANQ